MLSTLTTYQTTVRDLPRSLEIVKSDQRVKRETEYYLENIGNVKTIEDLTSDDRLFNYVMKDEQHRKEIKIIFWFLIFYNVKC